MEEWKEYKLEELSKGKGAYGIGASAVPFSDDKYTYLRITDINDDGTLNKNGLMSVDDEDAHKYVLCKNDIVFARTGNSTGRSYFYDGTDGTLVYAGFLIKFSLDEEKVNPRILKYYTHSKPYYDWVKSFDTGGTRGNINAKTYGAMPILLPPRNVQDRIVEILKSLDDKIEVNRRINEQLEELAQALFKSWFVDFEPFKDGEFVESELGMIPEGWKVCELSEIGDIVGGATPSKAKPEYYTPNGISWITPKDLSVNKNKFIDKGETDITELGYSKCSAKLMPKGSVLFSSRAPIGYIAIAKKELCTNQGFKSIVPKLAGTAFIYFYLKNNVSNIESMASGSTFKEASGSLMKSLKVVVPPIDLLHNFEEKVSSLFDKQEFLEEEITHLTNLRDTLLPKLMSGEIDVNGVEI